MKLSALFLFPAFVLLLIQCSGSASENKQSEGKSQNIFDTTALPKINGVSFVSTKKEVNRTEIVQPKIKLEANYLCFMPYGFVKKGSTELVFNGKWQWWGEKDTGVNQLIGLAQAAGYKVMLKPHVWKAGGAYTGNHGHENEEEWEKFELSYSNYILHFAKIAEQNKIALFCIGTEWKNFVLHDSEFWFGLIKKVRKVYDGKLTYAANWDEYTEVPFWNKLDYIGIDAYFPLGVTKTPQINELETALRPFKDVLKTMADSLQKQVLFTEYGYQSKNHTAFRPWESDQSGKVNLQAQINAYTAFYTTFWHEDFVSGGFLWKWFPENETAGGVKNNGFTPQNKPVERVIKLNYLKTKSP